MNIDKIKLTQIQKTDTIDAQILIKKIYEKKRIPVEHYHFYLNLSEGLFRGGLSNNLFKYSIKAIYRKKIIGVMLLSDFSLFDCLCWNDYESPEMKILEKERGIQSIFTGVSPTYQRKGIANKMVQYIKENYKEFDYLWGIQHESLSDMNYFLKKRKIIAEINEGIYTMQRLK
jgi:GNAT superfamily N-acetyltransferase